MTDGIEAAQAIAALAFGGFLFISLGGTLNSTMPSNPLINLELWGVIYIIAAIVLAVSVVYATARSILS